MRAPRPVKLLLILVMMVPVVALNGLLLHILAKQSLSAFLPQTPGLITYSEVVRSKKSYGFRTRFTYAVQGVEYESNRYRYAAWSSSNQSRVEDLAERFPVRARVPVFYDPESPGDAVLVTGMDGMYLYLLMFLYPFTAAALIGVRQILYGGPGGMREDTFGPLAVGIIAAGGVSFVLIFVMAFVMALDPPLIAPVLAWGVLLATGVRFAMRRRANRALPAAALGRTLMQKERAMRRSR